jgi:hypothetical protein
LTSGHDLTVPEIAQTTGLGKSTVAKALNRLAAAGHASRTSGTGSGVTRTPDRWNLAAEPDASDNTSSVSSSTKDSTPPTKTPRPTGTPAARKPNRATSTGRTTTTPQASVPTPPDASTQSTAEAQPTAKARPSANARPATKPAPTTEAQPVADADTVRNRVTGTVKLQPGALTQLVAGHFAAHPGTALTSGEVGRSLGRSSGAVRNACDKLVRDGDLRPDSDSPRRYALNTGPSTASTAS